jgi:excisionase family DNA binding protein
VDATLEREALMTLDDAAQMLGVSVATVRRMVGRHELVAVQLGGLSGRAWRIPGASLDAALRGWEARG